LKALNIFALLVIICCISTETFSQPQKNLEIIQELSEKSIDSLGLDVYNFLGDTLNIRFVPSCDSWIVENSIIKKIRENGRVILISDTNNLNYPIWHFAILNMGVEYGKTFYDGFLGHKKVVRSVNLNLSLKITSRGEVKKIDYLSRRYQDTVAYDSIHLLENDNMSSTKSALPDETFIDRILSPVIITSSVAVIVYLFFTLRK
jgi:hypothetical protein